MTSWIFQGNPKEFQVDEYLKRKEIYWNLEQHKKGTSLDDVVYIWRADGNKPKSGGIVAKGKIVDYPREMQDDAPELWIPPKPENSLKFGVNIEIEDVRLNEGGGMLKSEDLKKDVFVNDMEILVFPGKTNYRLKTKHSGHINYLWKQKKMK